jgi:hypothetical protein
LNVDFRQFYDLENYLFEVVGPRFRACGRLDAFDLFSIIIWKANRAKSRIARKLLESGAGSLDEVAALLTQGLAGLPGPKERLRYLWKDWGLRLPMASAILTVLYPDEFTIYDTRVCGTVGGFHSTGDSGDFDWLWDEYVEFRAAVEQAAPKGLCLRDKDRYLWGKSFRDQLRRDLEREFS